MLNYFLKFQWLILPVITLLLSIVVIREFRLMYLPAGSKYIDTISVSAIYSQSGSTKSGRVSLPEGNKYKYYNFEEITVGDEQVKIPRESSVEVPDMISIDNPLFQLYGLPLQIFQRYQLCVTNARQYSNSRKVSVTDRYVFSFSERPEDYYYSSYKSFEYPFCRPITQTGATLSFKMFFIPFVTMDQETNIQGMNVVSAVELWIQPVYGKLPIIVWVGTFWLVGSFLLFIIRLCSIYQSNSEKKKFKRRVKEK